MQNSYKTNGWQNIVLPELEKPYFVSLKQFLISEYAQGAVNPAKKRIFAALDTTARSDVRVVILGQDPYPNPAAAMGLCFSVPAAAHIAPSLVNIFKEIETDTGSVSACASSGDLTPWAQQGVLLLNTVLTCRAFASNSHKSMGWETFTDKIIDSLNYSATPIVFLLWGRQAQDKQKLITNPAHLILKAAHPSPLSAYNGFFGCRHFSRTNEFLRRNALKEVIW